MLCGDQSAKPELRERYLHMAIREIIKLGDEILRQVSAPVTVFDGRISRLLDDMKETMEYNKGAGLAAVQVGILKRIAIVDVGEGLIEMINPEIVKQSGSISDLEGCLSIEQNKGYVIRPEQVKVRAQDRTGKRVFISAAGFAARAICHELDHLDGTLYIDRLSLKDNLPANGVNRNRE